MLVPTDSLPPLFEKTVLKLNQNPAKNSAVMTTWYPPSYQTLWLALNSFVAFTVVQIKATAFGPRTLKGLPPSRCFTSQWSVSGWDLPALGVVEDWALWKYISVIRIPLRSHSPQEMKRPGSSLWSLRNDGSPIVKVPDQLTCPPATSPGWLSSLALPLSRGDPQPCLPTPEGIPNPACPTQVSLCYSQL